jgi:hypothetical protein
MQRSIVDFPDPDGPATTTASPVLIARLMSSKTTFVPKLFFTRSSTTS